MNRVFSAVAAIFCLGRGRFKRKGRKPHLRNIPPELRLIIYEYVFAELEGSSTTAFVRPGLIDSCLFIQIESAASYRHGLRRALSKAHARQDVWHRIFISAEQEDSFVQTRESFMVKQRLWVRVSQAAIFTRKLDFLVQEEEDWIKQIQYCTAPRVGYVPMAAKS